MNDPYPFAGNGIRRHMAHAAVLTKNRALARTFAQIDAYAAAWRRDNAEAMQRTGRLWVVLGDSCALGIGATAHDRGYVGVVRDALEARSGPWRVVNLAVSGARVGDVVDHQLPQLAGLPTPDLVTAVAGGNDLIGSPSWLWARDIARLAAALPPGAVLGTVPCGFRERKALRGNDAVRRAAARYGLRVADVWGHTGPPWRGTYSDGIHPSDVGHRRWAGAVLSAVPEVYWR